MTEPNDNAAGVLGVRMHDVTLNLHCGYDKLLEHTAGLLEGFAGPAWDRPDLEVRATWRTGSDEDRDAPFFDGGDLNGFGKRMLLGADRLVWPDTYRNKDLQLRFGRDDGVLRFDVGYHYYPSQKKLAKYPDYERKKFFDLLRYLVLFPIAWSLERTRGWVLVHASAVADEDRAVLIAGPGGAGKTTTSVALAARAGLSLVTENLLFTDGTIVRPLCEPIRLTDESLALLGTATAGLEPLGAATRLKYKSMYRLPPDLADRSFRPDAIFIPQFAQPAFLRAVEPAVAAETLDAVNRLTLELCDYDWYAAALDLLWPDPGLSRRRVEAIERLANGARCWSLGIDRAGGVAPVVERILECRPDRAVSGAR